MPFHRASVSHVLCALVLNADTYSYILGTRCMRQRAIWARRKKNPFLFYSSAGSHGNAQATNDLELIDSFACISKGFFQRIKSRLVPSRYLFVFAGREDWGLVEARGDSWEGTKEKQQFIAVQVVFFKR